MSPVKKLYRARILLGFLCAGLFALPLVQPPLPVTIALCWSAMVVWGWIVRWKCPRCNERFFIGPFLATVPWRRKCRSCDFELLGEP